MTIAERHKYILDELDRAGFVSVSDLAKRMEVTMVTIRKDLKLLEDKGLCIDLMDLPPLFRPMFLIAQCR